MRSLISLALGTVLVLVIGAGSVMAARPEQIRETGTFQLPDFCGTGTTVDVAFTSNRTLHWAGDELRKVTFQTKYVATAATSDNVVIDHQTGQSRFEIVPEANGGYAVVNSGRGLAEQIKLKNGPVLIRDAGLITFVDHFDADDNYLGTDITIHGPHPDFESNFALQCEVFTEALEL